MAWMPRCVVDITAHGDSDPLHRTFPHLSSV